jgi:hypothetical protein
MKTIKLGLVLSSVALAFVALGGCSSGGSSDAADTTLVSLTPAVAESMALSASEAINGCTYSSETVLPASTYTDIINKSPIKEAIANTPDSYVPYLATIIDATYVGTCPVPGYYTVVGTHEDGVDNLTYTFMDYCLGDENTSVTQNGSLSVVNVATPTDAGPIPVYSTVSTGATGIVSDEVSLDGNFTHVAKVSSLKYTYGNPVAGDTGVPTLENPDVLTIGSVSGADGRTGSTFSASNVNVSTYTLGTSSVTTIANLTYTDSVNGTVNVSSTPITVDATGLITNTPVVTVTGADGTSLVMESSTTVSNSFNVIVDGTTLGVMDCSALAIAL